MEGKAARKRLMEIKTATGHQVPVANKTRLIFAASG